MYDLILNAANPIPFVMVDSANAEITGLGSAFAVLVRKNGGVFAPSAGTKVELASGWYLYTATAGECDTEGPLALAITGAGAAQQNLVYRVSSIKTDIDAIRAITNEIDVSEVTYVASNNAGTLTITIGRTFSTIVSGLVIPADWETAFWTLKQNVNDDDPEALIQVMVSNPGDESIDGLRCLNAVAWHEAVEDDEETDEDETDPEPFDRELGALTVDQPGGKVTIYLQDDLTTQLSVAKRIGWDVKFIDANSDSTGTRGLANLVRTETQTV